MSTSQREINIYLEPGETKPVPINESQFVYVKSTIRPVVVTIEGQSISMEAGEKRRFDSKFTRVEVRNPDVSRPLSLVLVVGVGDYEKLVVTGEISFNPSLQLADGSRVGDSRQPENFYLDFDNKAGWIDTLHDLKDTSPSAGSPNKWAVAYDTKRDLYYFAGPYEYEIKRFDAETFTLLSDVVMPSKQGASGIAYNESTDELWLVGTDRVRQVNPETGTYNDVMFPVALTGGSGNGANFDPLTGNLMARVGPELYFLDPVSFAVVAQQNLSATFGSNPGAVARKSNGDYYLASTGGLGVTLFDSEFTDLGLGAGPTAYDMALDTRRNRYVVAQATTTIKKYVAETISWVGTAAVSDSPYRALIGQNYVNIQSAITIDDTGSRALLSGEVIRALLESYFGSYDTVPTDYLDYVYAFEYFDGTRRKVKQAGGESFLSAEYTDNFNAAAGQRMVLTVRDGLL